MTPEPNTLTVDDAGSAAEPLRSAEVKIHRIFEEVLELDVGVDTEVVVSGMLDSLAFVRLLMELEREFGVTVDLAALDLDDFETIAGIARLVCSGSFGRPG